MYPKLFGLLDTYYVIWSAALCLMVLWTRRRASCLYGIAADDASDILRWTLAGVFIGAALGGYLDNWRRYASDPVSILRFWESGVSSGPGFIGGGLLGLYRIRKLGLSVERFAESSSLPCAFMLALGRWGCFLNGCCEGLPTDSVLGVRFPRAPDTAVWPSQLFESFAAFVIGTGLLLIENKLRSKSEFPGNAVLFPLFLVTYGLYRIIFDRLRPGGGLFLLGAGTYSGIAAVAVGICWLVRSRGYMRRALS
ncbi:MAG: prolipoprotein diacylglyceryl transferase [Synergistaceae bacterium]|jgi:phosphatidylglycerol:prolipoprotein diacylglycerol transferase|nr:prolipoprotein diacylglyceryl transferase [Synergistaceae bacterium]